jgi:transcriptional antiterminator RfaH
MMSDDVRTPVEQRPDSAWFLAQLKPNSFRIAERNLARQGFSCFCPMEKQEIRRNNKVSLVDRPLFPGYVFVALDIAAGQWRKVNATVGVSRLVSFGAAPAEVPSGIVTHLQARCDDTGHLLPARDLQVGDEVLLKYGPFASMIAKIETIAPDRRVWVLMDIMGGKTRVGLSPDQVQPINP